MFHVRVQVIAGHQLPYGTTAGKCDPYVVRVCGCICVGGWVGCTCVEEGALLTRLLVRYPSTAT